jgi:hypothetical protein
MDKEFLTQLEILNYKMNFVKEQSFKGNILSCVIFLISFQ